MGSRGIISDLLRGGRSTDCSDKDVRAILESYMARDEAALKRNVRAVGGDFFSQDEYDGVKQEEDNVFSTLARKASEVKEDNGEYELSDDFCTETLAEIYAEQGYYAQAKRIYSKLSLNFPEKSAYFASLIEKVNKQTI